MPEAIAAETGDPYYRYIVEASPDDVLLYYMETMPSYGWQFVDYIPVEDVKEIGITRDDDGDGYILYLGFTIGFIFIDDIGEFTRVDIFHHAD